MEAITLSWQQNIAVLQELVDFVQYFSVIKCHVLRLLYKFVEIEPAEIRGLFRSRNYGERRKEERERERVPVGAGSVISGLQRSEVFYCGNKIHNRYDVPPWI